MIKCIGVEYFLKGIFQRALSQVATSQMCSLRSGNFPNVRLGLLRPEPPQAAKGEGAERCD